LKRKWRGGKCCRYALPAGDERGRGWRVVTRWPSGNEGLGVGLPLAFLDDAREERILGISFAYGERETVERCEREANVRPPPAAVRFFNGPLRTAAQHSGRFYQLPSCL
jgi:hypothetical protein